MHDNATGPPTTSPAPAREQHWLWIHCGLQDLYGPDRVDDLLALFPEFLADRGAELFSGDVVAWDARDGALSLTRDGTTHEATGQQWRQLADLEAFDRWLAIREAAEHAFETALAQLGKLGIAAPDAQGAPLERQIPLTPHQVLLAVEHAVRARVGTVGWDRADRDAAALLLGVGSSESTPDRDAAIRDASDPWLAAAHADAQAFSSPSAPATDAVATTTERR